MSGVRWRKKVGRSLSTNTIHAVPAVLTQTRYFAAASTDSVHRVKNPGRRLVRGRPQTHRLSSNSVTERTVSSWDGQEKFGSRWMCSYHVPTNFAQRLDQGPTESCNWRANTFRRLKNSSCVSCSPILNAWHIESIFRWMRSNCSALDKVNGHRAACWSSNGVTVLRRSKTRYLQESLLDPSLPPFRQNAFHSLTIVKWKSSTMAPLSWIKCP